MSVPVKCLEWSWHWAGQALGSFVSLFFFFFQSLAPSEAGICFLNLLIYFFLFPLKTCIEQSKGHPVAEPVSSRLLGRPVSYRNRGCHSEVSLPPALMLLHPAV